ncbi:MAG: hypothetical protein K0S32_4520 [Bacteroidetes bacterium]|jgi:lactate dehydrogenase-like 2-hydroxyacid dehydrogenase|nr:hypothetical protein [Bacteroidota bacterium]
MRTYKIAVIDYLTETSLEQKVIGENATLQCLHCKTEKEIPDSISEADAVLLYHHVTLTSLSLKKMKNVKLIVRVGVGFDNVDLETAGKLGITVVNVPDYGTNDVADHALGLLLGLARKINVFNEALEKDAVNNWKPEIAGEIHRLTNAKLGIVGLGRIGTAFALRAKALGLQLSFYDPYLASGWDKVLNITRKYDLKEMLGECDYVSIHTPLTTETRGMFNSEIISACKTGATIINVSRGEIISIDAMYESLLSNKIKAYGVDVLEQEPPSPDHPLIKAFMSKADFLKGRLIITPHMAFYAKESREELRVKSAQLIRAMIDGKPLWNCVNQKYLVNPPIKVLNAC